MRASILGTIVGSSGKHADGRAAEAQEAQIQKNLPKIEGLVQGLSQDARMAVFDKTIAAQRAAFIAEYGDPFGTERRAAKRPKVPGDAIIRTTIRAFAI